MILYDFNLNLEIEVTQNFEVVPQYDFSHDLS